jgi:ubiquinone/menaquinone biosynthesis C-methylase UbiE
VYASDPSAEQIAAAASAAGVTFVVEPAETCSLADNSADLVLAAQSLHWFDHPRFFAEVQRVLRPGGIVAAIGYSWFQVDHIVDAVIERAFLQPLQSFWADENRLLWDGYRTVAFPGVALGVPQAQIECDWTREELLTYLESWSGTRRWLAADAGQGFSAAAEELRSVWPDDQPRRVTMPMAVRAHRLP